MAALGELYNDVEEFCSTTSIQGLRNVTDPKQGWVSRVLWLIVVASSLILSGICIKESFDGNDWICLDLFPHICFITDEGALSNLRKNISYDMCTNIT
jgi:hypothetical protein